LILHGLHAGAATVGAEIMDWAIALGRYWQAQTFRVIALLSANPGQIEKTLLTRLKSFIAEHGPVSLAEMHRDRFRMHSRTELREAIDALLDDELIAIAPPDLQAKAGRPTVRYVAQGGSPLGDRDSENTLMAKITESRNSDISAAENISAALTNDAELTPEGEP
jgi:hypothetical protein